MDEPLPSAAGKSWVIGILLLPVSWLYGVAVEVRNRMFDWGLLWQTGAGVPVISVGNMTAGGTGKTPLVEYIVRYLLEKKRRVAVVSRGYGRVSRGMVVVSDGQNLLADALEGGDEPVQLARKFPAARVVVCERRVKAAKKAVELGAEIIVMDDGFQHRYLKRDVDIVVVDSGRGLTGEKLLPAGLKREPLHGLGRASLIAFSRGNDPAEVRHQADKLLPYFDGKTVTYTYRFDGLFRHADHTSVPTGASFFAFSGIGDHRGFVDGLTRWGIPVKGDAGFPDHYRYNESDMRSVEEAMRRSGADICVTTEKDAVRLMSLATVMPSLSTFTISYARITVEFVNGEQELRSMIDACLEGGRA